MDESVLVQDDALHDRGRWKADQDDVGPRCDILRRRTKLRAAVCQSRHRGRLGVEHHELAPGIHESASHRPAHAADAHEADYLTRHHFLPEPTPPLASDGGQTPT
jgi:hypothetical protein